MIDQKRLFLDRGIWDKAPGRDLMHRDAENFERGEH